MWAGRFYEVSHKAAVQRREEMQERMRRGLGDLGGGILGPMAGGGARKRGGQGAVGADGMLASGWTPVGAAQQRPVYLQTWVAHGTAQSAYGLSRATF